MSLMVTGLGGCGQTFFMKHLKNNVGLSLNDICDRDGLKHVGKKSQTFVDSTLNRQDTRIIMVISDSFNMVCSHFRRKWAQVQINKLDNIHKIDLKNEGVSSIDDYLQLVERTGKDYFGIVERCQSWYGDPRVYFHNFNNPNFELLMNHLHIPYTTENFEKIRYEVLPNDKYEYLKSRYLNAYLLYKKIDDKI